MKFRSSDAWLLASIFWAHRGEGKATLQKIIAVGDAINHAIFNPDEIEGGLARLTGAGLVREDDGVFAPSGRAVEWFREFEKLPLRTVESMAWVSAKLEGGWR